jgi:hypothetical protein
LLMEEFDNFSDGCVNWTNMIYNINSYL